MDALSDVLRTVKLSGAVYLNGEFGAPWCVAGPADAALCASFLPKAKEVVTYHLVTEGSCWARLAGADEPALELSAGELLVVPQGETHVMSSAPDLLNMTAPVLTADDLDTTPGEIIRVSFGGGGAKTRVICGFLACDETMGNPLIASLPRMFKVDVRNGSGSAWLESSLRFASEEAAVSRAGGTTILAKLSELLFVEAVRRCIETLPEGEKNWLAGLRDRFVGRALALLHAEPARAWTVDELARKVGLSRSALAQRFTDFVGQPPMQYLASWRLRMASNLLREEDESIALVAERVGYESEAAFNRAFKREFGTPPASWRRSAAEANDSRKSALSE
ncbi:MAG: AraC family transcriptional regulator [Betaproteobacteria bacterium]